MSEIYIILQSIIQAKTLKIFISSILWVITWLFWGYSLAVHALLILMLIDFLLGLGYAFFGKDWKPSKAKFQMGLKKRVFSLIAIMAGNVFDYMIFWGVAEYGAKWLLTLYVGSDEFVSILGHLQKMGVPIPVKAIERVREYQDSLLSKTKL